MVQSSIAALSGCEPVIGADWDRYGSAGGPACVSPAADCPPSGRACAETVCQDGACAERPLPEGTPCAQGGGTQCDGHGACVARCNDGELCPAGACVDSTCLVTCGTTDGGAKAPPSCPSSEPADGCGAGAVSCCDSKLVGCGTFLRDHAGADMSDPLRSATLSDFRLDTYEVTVGRFRRFVAAGQGTQTMPPAPGSGAHPKIDGSGWDPAWNVRLPATTAELKAQLLSGEKCSTRSGVPFGTWTDEPGQNEKKPLNCVTWYVAFAFCAWDGGRLPTDAEWSYAAAGGSEQRLYPWGSASPDPTYASYGCNSTAAGCRPSDIVEVGSFPKGRGYFGHADLAGSVREWLLDIADELDSYVAPCVDCAELAASGERAMRGGSFGSGESDLRVVVRRKDGPDVNEDNYGVRCARAP